VRSQPVSQQDLHPWRSETSCASLRGVAAVKDSKLVGHCRVSTAPQTVQLQRDALTAAGCIRIFQDKVSSRVKDRTGLLAALDYLRIR
jgi:Resolvase, N terminal domain